MQKVRQEELPIGVVCWPNLQVHQISVGAEDLMSPNARPS
jgi:hypothetical protein